MGTLRDLSRRLNVLRKRLPEQVNQLKVDIAEEIVTHFAMVTPVDTSKALSNWQIGIGSAAGGEIEAHFVGTLGSTEGISVGATISAAKTKLANSTSGVSVHITNNADYITDLDQGSSRQFAGGFDRRAILIAQNALRTFRIKL